MVKLSCRGGASGAGRVTNTTGTTWAARTAGTISITAALASLGERPGTGHNGKADTEKQDPESFRARTHLVLIYGVSSNVNAVFEIICIRQSVILRRG
jgi:hypothetical protein